MALRVAIDTNSYADYCRGVTDAVQVIRRAELIVMPIVVLGELRGGFMHGAFQEANERILAEFLRSDRVSVLSIDEATTHFYGDIYADLRRRGKPVPTNDMWIAALVIQHQLTLLTRDRHFEAIPRVPRV